MCERRRRSLLRRRRYIKLSAKSASRRKPRVVARPAAWRRRGLAARECVVCHSFRRCGPPDRTRAQSRLLSRRMLGSLYRRFFLVSVQAARGRYRHVRMASRARCTSRAHGQVQGSNFFLRLLLALWPACEIARPAARRTTRQPPVWCSRPPPAARHTRCAGSGLESMPLCRYAAMPLRRYVATPLCRYVAMSLCRCVAVPRGAHARV